MSKFQMTTTAGAGGLVGMATKLASLFAGYAVEDIGKAIMTAPADQVILVLFGLSASVWAIIHDEDKKEY